MPLVPPLQCLPYNHSHHCLMLITNCYMFICRPGSPTRPEASGGSVPYLILFHTFYSGTWSALDRYVIRLEKKFQCQHLQQSVIQLECPCKHRSPFCESQMRGAFLLWWSGQWAPWTFQLFSSTAILGAFAHSITLHLPTCRAQATSSLFATYNGGNLSTTSVNI